MNEEEKNQLANLLALHGIYDVILNIKRAREPRNGSMPDPDSKYERALDVALAIISDSSHYTAPEVIIVKRRFVNKGG